MRLLLVVGDVPYPIVNHPVKAQNVPMSFFELESTDISALTDGELRELVARLCEAELTQQGIPPSCVTWGGAQEAADGGLDVYVRNAVGVSNLNFVPRENIGFQVKKHSMSAAACKKEMEENGKPKAILRKLAASKGGYIIVSGKDSCSEKMLSSRLNGMKNAITGIRGRKNLLLDFYGQDRLSTWLRQHPSVALWVRSRLGKPLTGWRPFGRWAATPPNLDDEFLIDDHPSVIDMNSTSKHPFPVIEGIQLVRDRMRKFGSTVRITGLSGVGKTRFAQALFESNVGHDALPASDVIYADLGNDLAPTATQLVSYLVANDFTTYLVLDNCPPDVHRVLQKQVSESGPKLHLLTIEYDISDDKPEETDVIHLEPTSEKTVSLLVQRRFPYLGRINADQIAEFASGNPRVALALASRVDADETLSNFSDEDLFRRLFSQRKGASTDLLLSAEVLALMYSFNVSRSEFHDELSVLSAISALPRPLLHRHQAELLRRHLAQQRGNWRAILPHALANRLAKRALENILPDEINAELFKPENLRLFQSCAHRLGYLHDVESARTLALTWIQPGAPLNEIESCGDGCLVVLEYVAPVFPDVVLQAIERASTVDGFASRQNTHFNRFVRLLCQIAYEDETFDRATELLLKFAETEREGENYNSIVQQLGHLFSLHLSGTEATPKRRQAFVRKLVNSDSSRHQEIAKQLLHHAFEAYQWTSIGTFHFGARKRGHGWSPETVGDAVSWYVGFIELLIPKLKSTKQRDINWVKELLASRFRGLWSFAGCFDVLEKIIRDHGKDGRWPEIWMSIKSTIQLDGSRHSPELLSRLESLQKLTEPTDLYSQIEAFALFDTWEHTDWSGGNHSEKASEICEKVFKLGSLVASQTEWMEQFGRKLWGTDAQPIFWLGKGLAVGSEDKFSMFDSLAESFQKHLSERANVRLLEGYIFGVNEQDSNLARQILERALKICCLRPYSVRLLTTIPITPWVFEVLIELAREAELEAWRFEEVGYGRIHEPMSDKELAELLTEINALERGYISTLRILSMRLFERQFRQYTPNGALLAVGRTAIRRLASAHRDEIRRAQLRNTDGFLDEIFSGVISEREIKEIIELLCEGVESYRLYSFELTEVFGALIKKYPQIFLDVIYSRGERGASLADSLFREYAGGKDISLNDIPIGQILIWCGDDQDRINLVAKSVHAYSVNSASHVSQADSQRVVLSEHIKCILDAAKDKPAVIECIVSNVWPKSWSGSRAEIADVRSKAFAKLLDYPDVEVQEIVKTKLSALDQSIRKEREREIAEHNEREQRFE